MHNTPELKHQVSTLLEMAGHPTPIASILPCAQGGNNRTFRLETSTGAYAVKQYFRQEADTRDRLASEFSFLAYAKAAAPNMVPTPFSQDISTGYALYEFIEGQPIKPNSITDADVSQAIDFFKQLNHPQARAKANNLPLASEACFSIQDHLNLVAARIKNLQQISTDSPEDKAAEHLISQLSARWQSLHCEIKCVAASSGEDLTLILDNAHRCLSPSDFGFHNALKTADGSLRFLDFEYAGWDDPGKMTGDFFSQLAVPVPTNYFDQFVQQTMSSFNRKDDMIRRAKLLRSVYQVKWCCIALNIFIPVNLARRQFANPNLNMSDLKKTQLAKADSLLQKIGSV